MNSISKAILLSAVSLCVDSGSLTFASTQIPLSIPKKSGISTLHTYHTHIRHTLKYPNLSSRLFDDLMISGEEQKVASVCFITDAGNCSGDKFGNSETPDGTNRPDYDTIPEQCRDAGYTKTSCPPASHLENPCPSDKRYYERCECDDNITEVCNIPYYGVGPSCDGKYASCKRDNDRACRESGYTQTGSCPTLQVPNRRCPYDSSYYDRCVCQSGLVSCPYPKVGVGSSCGGKYKSCCTPYPDESGCQYGTTTASDGCGGTRTVCKSCSPLPNQTNCEYGYVLGSDGCGGTRNVCKSCTPLSDETNCQYGTTTASDGCGGTRTVCKGAPECTPLSDETGCQYGTTSASDGCGGTRTVCKDCTPLSDETNCKYGTTTSSDGCGGTRTECICRTKTYHTKEYGKGCYCERTSTGYYGRLKYTETFYDSDGNVTSTKNGASYTGGGRMTLEECESWMASSSNCTEPNITTETRIDCYGLW